MKRWTVYLLFSMIVIICSIIVPQFFSVQAESSNKTVEEYFQKQTVDQKEAGSADEGTVEETEKQTSFSFFDFLKMIFALVFVLMLLYLLLKLLNRKFKLPQESKYLQNLGGVSLGQNKSVQMIKIGNRILILGVGETIELLREIEDEEEYKEIIDMHKEPDFPSVEQHMMRLFQKNGKKTDQPDNSFKNELESLLKERRERMVRLKQKGSKR